MTAAKKPKAPKFDMKPAKSSSLSMYGYDEASKTLAVTFMGGATYHYADVPKSAVDAMADAKSIGGHFAAHVRDKFKGTRQ